MSADLNRVTLIGRLTKDPDTRYSANNDMIVKFSIANSGYKDDDVSFFNCVCFKHTAKFVDQYITKGKLIAIDGVLKQSRWDADDGSARSRIEIIVNSVQSLTPKNSQGNNQSNQEPQQQGWKN